MPRVVAQGSPEPGTCTQSTRGAPNATQGLWASGSPSGNSEAVSPARVRFTDTSSLIPNWKPEDARWKLGAVAGKRPPRPAVWGHSLGPDHVPVLGYSPLMPCWPQLLLLTTKTQRRAPAVLHPRCLRCIQARGHGPGVCSVPRHQAGARAARVATEAAP